MALPKGSTSGETYSQSDDDEEAILAAMHAAKKEAAKKQNNRMNSIATRAEKLATNYSANVAIELKRHEELVKSKTKVRNNQVAELEAEMADVRKKILKEIGHREDVEKKTPLAAKNAMNQLDRELVAGLEKLNTLHAQERSVVEQVENLWENGSEEESE